MRLCFQGPTSQIPSDEDSMIRLLAIRLTPTRISAKNIPANSRTPAALPAATPTITIFARNLSAGGKARIAISATLEALLLTGVALWAWRLHREKKFRTRARNPNDREDTLDKDYGGTGMDGKPMYVLGAESTVITQHQKSQLWDPYRS